MDSAQTNVLRTGGGERRRYLVRFNPNGGSDPDPTVTFSTGGVATVIRNGATGTYRVRFAAGVLTPTSIGSTTAIRYRGADYSTDAATGNRALAGPVTQNSDGTIDFTVFTVDVTGALVDIASNASRQVVFWVEMDIKG